MSAPTQPSGNVCELPPGGWYCNRPRGHEGPCAARTRFVRAEDQQQAAREAFAEIFFDEDEIYWLVAEGRTAEEAIALASNVDPPEEQPAARLVCGCLGMNGYDRYFKLEKNGPVEMWEVSPYVA